MVKLVSLLKVQTHTHGIDLILSRVQQSPICLVGAIAR